jgi:hypothetical protein
MIEPTGPSNRAWGNEIRPYQVYLTNDRKPALLHLHRGSHSSFLLQGHGLIKDWSLEKIIPARKKPQKLLVVPPLPKSCVAAGDLGAREALTYFRAAAHLELSVLKPE